MLCYVPAVLAPLQILTHQTVGVGSPIADRLLRSPDAKLSIGSSVSAAHREGVQALLNQCGRLQATDRPRMEEVLNQVDEIRHALNEVPASAPAPPLHDAATDRAALMALYDETDELWRERQGWGTSAPLRD